METFLEIIKSIPFWSILLGGFWLYPLLFLPFILFYFYKNKNKQKPKIIGVVSDYSLNKNNKLNYSFHPVHILREQYINNLSSICSDYNVVFIIIPIDSNQINKFVQIVDGKNRI